MLLVLSSEEHWLTSANQQIGLCMEQAINVSEVGEIPTWKEFQAKDDPVARGQWLAKKWAKINGPVVLSDTIEAILENKFSQTKYPEQIVPELPYAASLSHHTDEGYEPGINIGEINLDADDELKSSCDHERIHAVQYHFNAVAHAIPSNLNTRVILSPRRAIILNLAMEREAYTGQWLLAQRRKGLADAGQALSHAMLERARRYSLRIAENGCNTSNKSFLEHYTETVLADYKKRALKRALAGEKFIFADIDAEHMRKFGNTLGLDLYGPEIEDAEWMLKECFPTHVLKQIFELNDLLGVKEKPFEEALDEIGHTEASFLAENTKIKKQEPGRNFVPGPTTVHQI
jgi:hypothetical protein